VQHNLVAAVRALGLAVCHSPRPRPRDGDAAASRPGRCDACGPPPGQRRIFPRRTTHEVQGDELRRAEWCLEADDTMQQLSTVVRVQAPGVMMPGAWSWVACRSRLRTRQQQQQQRGTLSCRGPLRQTVRRARVESRAAIWNLGRRCRAPLLHARRQAWLDGNPQRIWMGRRTTDGRHREKLCDMGQWTTQVSA